MRKALKLFWVFAAGVLLGLATRGIPVTAEGGGAAAPSGNGDVNGDGQLNLTDPIYLLKHLFQSGPAPVPIDCGNPPANGPKVRFLDDILCGTEFTAAKLDLCGTKIIRQTAQDWGECESLKAVSNCTATITVKTANCDALCFTVPVSLKDDHAYDFAISADNQGVFALWFDRQGNCATAPPTDQDVAAGMFQGCPAAALALEPGSGFESFSGWKRPDPE